MKNISNQQLIVAKNKIITYDKYLFLLIKINDIDNANQEKP